MATAVEKDGLAIPLIDFSTFLSGDSTSKKQTAQAILHAFQTSGFVYLSNHGIQNPTVETAFQKSASFFDRSQEQKDALSWYSPEANRGYTAHGREKVTQLVDKNAVEALRAAVPDLKESLEIGRDDEEGMPNMWPSGDEEADVFKEIMLAFFDECKDLHTSVMRALALGLGIEESWFDGFTDRGDNTLRLLHYPSVSKDVFRKNEMQVRAGSHTDYGSITLLFQDSRGGLQVESPNGTFVDATPIPGTIVVNAGDLLARWSNETIKSTTHRVVEPPPKPEPQSLSLNRNFQAPLSKSQILVILDEADAKTASKVKPVQPTPRTARTHSNETAPPMASSANTPAKTESPNPGCGPQDSSEDSTLYHLPTKEQLAAAFELHVLDKDGKKHNFGELCHNGSEGVERNLVVFIRHWFCGVCQSYISALSSSIPPTALSALSPPTRLTIIGCGADSLIPQYLKTTSCPYTLYTDPTASLYKIFNFGRTLEMGKEPGYLKGKNMWELSWGGMMQTIRTGWKARGGGDWMQVGGEFLFVREKETGDEEWRCKYGGYISSEDANKHFTQNANLTLTSTTLTSIPGTKRTSTNSPGPQDTMLYHDIQNSLPAGMATSTNTTIKNEIMPPGPPELDFLEKREKRDEEKKSLVGEQVKELNKELGTLKAQDSESNSAISKVPATPPNPFYEIRQTPDKGISIFAKAPIPRGTLILAEKPLMRITQAHYMAEHVDEAVEKLTAKDKKKYWSLSSAHGQDRSRYPSRIHPDVPEHEKSRIRQQHEARTGSSPTAFSIFMTNAMECHTGAAIFEIAARFNHSCIPNAFFSWNTTTNEERIYASHAIEAGEEITLSYVDPFYEPLQRKWELQHYGFACGCLACVNLDDEESFGANSRERRFRLAGLEERSTYPETFKEALMGKIEIAAVMREEGLSGACLGDTLSYLSIARLVANNNPPDFKFALTAATQALDVYTTCLGADSEKAIEAAKSARAFKKQIDK
ncbi:hypothetical protein BLS_000565 [Venturia inaequalis]|uniref:Fe2OG dioxygenase domain-containing protein n=1 Tax=Venturia inaequalis TaxID=5025 RepID=A0A8H3U300_VENIN|nr:hypothetical protein BLS_000565 [Venturia inaequalis]